MPVSRIPTARARAQAARHVREWLEDHPEAILVRLDLGSLWISDFDGNVVQMRKLTVAEFEKHGWRLRRRDMVLAKVG